MASSSFLLIFAIYVAFVCGHPFVTIDSIGEGIIMDGANIRCGSLSCPATSTGCIYQKRTNEHDPRLVDVMRRCVDQNGVTTAESFNQIEGVPGLYYNTIVKSGSQSSNVVVVDELSPEQEAKLQRQIEQVNRHVQSTVEQVNRNVQNTVDQAMQNLNRQLKNLDQVYRITF